MNTTTKKRSYVSFNYGTIYYYKIGEEIEMKLMSWILDMLSELWYQIDRHMGGTFYTSRRARRVLKERYEKAAKEGKWVCVVGRRY